MLARVLGEAERNQVHAVLCAGDLFDGPQPSADFRDGLLTLLLRHTSASLLIQENADPDVRRDLDAFFARLVRDGDPLFVHTAEGDDDMAAHIRTALTAVNLSLPLRGGELALGTWQGIYLWEHRTHPHSRRVTLHFIGV